METDKNNSGISAYRGYEYQILATVWIALELIFKQKSSKEIIVEPVSGEDIAVGLNVDAEDATSTINVCPNEVCLEIQIKLRQSGHWTSSKFLKLLTGKTKAGTRGPQQRKRPLEILRSSSGTQYLLLTNAQIKNELQDFEIVNVGEKSKATTIPGEQTFSNNQDVAQRIGILSQRENQRLILEINEILRSRGHVPTHNCPDCQVILKEAVRKRLLGERERNWSQEEIVAAIRKAGGVRLIEKQDLIKPNNYNDINQQVSEKHKLLLSGPPGTGKTFLAEHIANIHRLDADPFEVVTEDKGISYIRKCLERNGRFLFFLNDPWGIYKLSQEADKWTTELPKLLKKSDVSKRFLVTSRLGIRQHATGNQSCSELVAAEIFLTEEHYDVQKKKAILDIALKDSKPWQRDVVEREHKLILDKLRVPYSLVVFANQLSRIESEENVDVKKILKDSNIEAIGSSIAKEVIEMGAEAIASAIALWARIMAKETLTEELARQTRRVIRAGGYDSPLDTIKLYRWFVGAKWFQTTTDSVTVHPTVLDGLESLIDSQPGITEDALLALLNGLVLESSQSITLEIIKQLKGRNFPVPASVQSAINIFLLTRLKNATGYEFSNAFSDISKWSTSDDPVTTLVHLLSKKKKNSFLGASFEWVRSELEKTEIDKISASQDAFECAANFITEILPSGHNCSFSASELVMFLNQFIWDMSKSFLTAAETAIERGDYELDELVKGVFLYPSPDCDRLLKVAFKALDNAGEWWDEFQENYRKAEQGECNAAYASHLYEEPEERFGPIETAFKLIVRYHRRAEGYKWLVEHPRIADLLESWVAAVDESTDIEEIRAIQKCSVSDQRPTWKAIQQACCTELADKIIKGLVESPEEHLHNCFEILCDFLTPDQWQELVIPSLHALPFERKAIIWHFTVSLSQGTHKTASGILPLIETTFSHGELVCVKACHNVSDNDDYSFSSDNDDNYELMRQLLLTGPDILSIRAAFFLAKNQKPFQDHLKILLQSDNVSVRVNAIRLSGSLKNKTGKKLLRSSLNDPDFRCRREAMLALACQADHEDKNIILSKADDPSAPVRKTCAKIIGNYGWGENQSISILLKLLNDKRDFSEDLLFRSHVPQYQIARAAANSLGNIGQLSKSKVNGIVDFLKNRDLKSDDIVVHYQLLEVLGRQKKQGQRVLSILEKFLGDSWHMPGNKHEGFPLRYAAAWCIARQLWNDESLADVLSFEKIYQGAIHTDSRLAGPCLFCFGLLGKKAQHKIIQLLQDGSMTENRALLILLTLSDDEDSSLQDILIEFIGEKKPGMSIFLFSKQSPQPSEEEWKKLLDENKDAAKWIEDLQTGKDVYPLLRFVLHDVFENDISESFFKFEDLRKNDLAKSIPVMNLRTMSGGE